MGEQMKFCEMKYIPKYFETDQMSVVYHGNYFTWFESARDCYFKGMGMSYSTLEKCGILMPVTESHCQYIVSAKYDEELKIKVRLERISCARCSFKYEITRMKDSVLIAKATISYAFVDRTFKPINIKKRIWNYGNC